MSYPSGSGAAWAHEKGDYPMTNLELFDMVRGFEIMAVDGGYRLIDRCPINNWGLMEPVFATAAHAAERAHAYDDFKCGRTMRVRETPTGFES